MARTDRNTLSPTALAHQLEKAHRDIADKDARIKALEAVDRAVNGKSLSLLDRVAECLLLADVAANAVQSSPADGATGHVKKFEQPTPGASTKLARRARNRLTKSIDEACAAFEQAADNEFVHQRVDDGIPRLRCRHRNCPAMDIRVKAWQTSRNGKKVPAERCTSCGNPLTPVDSQENEHG